MQQNQPHEPYLLHYFIGLCLGLIPLILLFIDIGQGNTAGFLGSLILLLYFAEWIAAFVCLVMRRVRFVGYGLLTMALISPVVYYIACSVAIQQGLICVYRCVSH